MIQTKLNLNNIVYIEAFDFSVSDNWIYKKEKNFLLWKRKEGFYYKGIYGSHQPEDFKDSIDCVVQNDKVYNKPHIKIYLNGNPTVHYKYFNSKDELITFLNSYNLNNIVWVNL